MNKFLLVALAAVGIITFAADSAQRTAMTATDLTNDSIQNVTDFSKKPAKPMLEFTGAVRETDCLQSSLVVPEPQGSHHDDNEALTTTSNIDPIKAIAAVRIAIDPGHGGEDPGACSAHGVEKEINLAVSLQLKDLLENNGFAVLLTRETDSFVSLTDRTDLAAEWHADLFVSVHCNSAANDIAAGIETYMLPVESDASSAINSVMARFGAGISVADVNAELAMEIQHALVTTTSARSRGVKSARFKVLREATCPAVLVETGFLTSAEEGVLLGEATYQEKIAAGITSGLVSFTRLGFGDFYSVGTVGSDALSNSQAMKDLNSFYDGDDDVVALVGSIPVATAEGATK